MRRAVFLLWASGLAAGCSEYGGPSTPHGVYALARVGSVHLPVSFNGDGTPPFLLADTLRLAQDRPRNEQQILRRITVMQQQLNGASTRSEAEYGYEISNGVFAFVDCPIGSLCIASLVYAPRSFRIVGDSLLEVLPPGATSQPHVYGMVRF